jgi:ceramide glucosyltransferase
MMHQLALALSLAAALGLCLIAVQCLVLRRHVNGEARCPARTPPLSILKPLCGLDDALEANLAGFAELDYPEYEVLLGVRSTRDPAWRVACAVARRWPGRFRVVLQRGEPGLNPKVNQLLTLERAARHDLLVVSDSNVRVEPGYLAEIAALLDDETVGLVTHPIVGVGERSLGSTFDSLHLAGAIGPGIVAATRLGRGVVVGKSMALRRADLRRMGGFEAVKDVLAEDYVAGVLMTQVVGKRIAVGRRPVQNVSERHSVARFAARYRRWAVLQRQAVGPAMYASQVLLNPVLLASAAVALERTPGALAWLFCVCGAKATLDGAAARLLRPGGFALARLALLPAKDLLFATAWAYGLVRREVEWRGTRLRVHPGTRIESPIRADGPALPLAGAAEETGT